MKAEYSIDEVFFIVYMKRWWYC